MPHSKSQPRVGILLSSYNGERFLPGLLDSLLGQDYPNLRIQIRDDGSTDGTGAILRRYALQHPRRPLPLSDEAQPGGAHQPLAGAWPEVPVVEGWA